MHRDENGYIVVETVGTFIPFVLLVISILSLVNIVTLQARVHNALTQTAKTLSMYSYVLQVTGVADDFKAMDAKASGVRDNINSVLSGIDALSKSSVPDKESINKASNWVEEMAGDPKAAIQGFANFGLSKAQSAAFAELARPLVGRYLANGEMTGDEYLKSVRVANFKLTDCTMVDKNGNVKMTAEYEIEYTFGALKLPFNPHLRVTQTVVTKAWLNGSGEGYW